jgi:hypothetical protein
VPFGIAIVAVLANRHATQSHDTLSLDSEKSVTTLTPVSQVPLIVGVWVVSGADNASGTGSDMELSILIVSMPDGPDSPVPSSSVKYIVWIPTGGWIVVENVPHEHTMLALG